MGTHEVLVKARNRLAVRGYDWYTRALESSAPCCPEGAVLDALGIGWEEWTAQDCHPPAARPAYREVCKQLGQDTDDLSHAVVEARLADASLDTMLAVFDRAIAATAPEPQDPFTVERPQAPVAGAGGAGHKPEQVAA